jgi:NitT/TauT family transport system permease protein
MMYDFSFGGVYDDAFSATILTHIWKSMTRVYGGFFLAALIGIPLGLMIGRIRLLRQLLDPTINLLRPIPVTAWLPLSMIFFGLGPNAAIFLVFLGAFYPILPPCWAARAPPCSARSCFRPRCRRSSTGFASPTALPGS